MLRLCGGGQWELCKLDSKWKSRQNKFYPPIIRGGKCHLLFLVPEKLYVSFVPETLISSEELQTWDPGIVLISDKHFISGNDSRFLSVFHDLRELFSIL